MPETTRDEMVMSFTRVRMALGILGLSLPFFLLIGGCGRTTGSNRRSATFITPCIATSMWEPFAP
ncbi:MAG: hypothetical protein P8N72_05150 [Flavimaricola sp.]|nr:hypothetical protein [Flavimaricola sp.]